MVSVPASITSLLESLKTSLVSATSAFPEESSLVVPPASGISLLDVKNELLLSYLQNLVFLIILKLRNDPESPQFIANVVQKLNEQRLYLERGVRPLEGRLKYQIDFLLRAASEAGKAVTAGRKLENGIKMADTQASHNLGSSEDSDAESNSATSPTSEEELPQRSLQANAAGLLRTENSKDLKVSRPQTSDLYYKPPKITSTVMPTGSSRTESRPRARKSALLDEYINDSLTSAPMAQPSIGSNSTILASGRSGLSARQRETQRERVAYEETNFTRLPTMTKAERRKAKAQEGTRDIYGGEDWTGLGGLGDRVVRSVSGGRKVGALERCEKRGRDTQDAVRGDGTNLAIGESFEKRRRIMQGRMAKGKGRGRVR